METKNMSKSNRLFYTKKIAQEIGTGQLILRNSDNTSRCWQIFAKIEDLNGAEVQGFVQCRVCKKVFVFRAAAPSNLVRHRCYIERYLQKQQSSISMVEFETPKLDSQKSEDFDFVEAESPKLEGQESEDFGDSYNHLLKIITKWVINECKPYDIIQDAGLTEVFKEFIALGAKFGTDIDVEKFLPHLTTISRNVSEKYEQCFQKVKAEIAAIKDNGFGLTTDIWTDSYTMQSYIAVTIHYLKNGSLNLSLLGIKPINGERLTTHNIYETINTILTDFGCELSNESIVVTNGDDVIVKAFQNNRIPNFQCISILLQNVLKNSVEAVPEVAELASACTKLINFLKESEVDADFSSSLQSYTPSRYSTIFNMLSSIENNWSDISQTLESRNESYRIKPINMSHLKAVNKVLQTFEEAIEALEEDGDATLHLVLVYLHRLQKLCAINDSEFKDFDFIEHLKENLQLDLEEILTENITILHKMALFLYPPTNKLLLFSDQEKICIEDECKRLCLEHAIKRWTQQEAEATSTSLAKRNKLFSDFVEPEAKHGPSELISQELQRYKNMYVKNRLDFDCFRWWELHKDVFPLLYKLSCCILAAPASISSALQVFTVGGTLTSETMEFDSKQTDIEKIIFINFNGEQDFQ